MSCNAGATWYSGPFFRSYRCLHYGEALVIQADGYCPVDRLLVDFTNSSDYHNLPVPPPIMIRLKRCQDRKTGKGNSYMKRTG